MTSSSIGVSRRFAVVATVCASLLPVAGTSRAQSTQNIGPVSIKAGVVEMIGNTIRASGRPKPQVKSLTGAFDVQGDSITVTLNPKSTSKLDQVKRIVAEGATTIFVKQPNQSLDLNAQKVVVEMNPSAKTEKDLIQSVVAAGSVVIDTKGPAQSAHVTASSADYSPANQAVVFTGNVDVTVKSLELPQPTKASGEKLTLWLRPTPDGPRIRLEGANENSPATLEITPPEQKKKAKS